MGLVRIMNKHFSFWIKFHTWKKVFRFHSWRLFKENPSRKIKMSEQNILFPRREHQPQQQCDSKSQSLFVIALAVITVVSTILFSIVWPLIIPDCVWCQWPYINDIFDDDGIHLLFFSSSLLCRFIRFLLTDWGILSYSRYSKETKMIQQTLRLWPF